MNDFNDNVDNFQSLLETEKFHRPKSQPTFEYFTEEMSQLGNQCIRDVFSLLKKNNFPVFDINSYFKSSSQ